MPGNSPPSWSRSSRVPPPTGDASLQRDDDVGVGGPDRRRVAVGEVEAAVRDTDVVDDRVELVRRDQPRGSCRRSGRSRRAVSSMRVPVRARTWSLIWPLSTAGKKSRPSHGKSTTTEPTQTARKIERETEPRRRQAPLERGGDTRRASARSAPRTALHAGRRAAPGLAVRQLLGVVLVPPQEEPRHRRHERAREEVRRRASRRRRPPRAARRDSARRRSGRTSARTRCRSTSVETNAGTAICAAPSRIACAISLPCAMLRLMFSISTVASSTRMPTARANPPSVMMLIVSPRAERIEERHEDRERDRDGDDERASPAARGRAGSSAPSGTPR